MRVRSALLLLLLGPGLAGAQVPAEFLDRPIATLAHDAFASRYGQLLVQEGARVVHESADPACLRSRGIEPASLDKRVGEIYVRNAARKYDVINRFVNPAKFEAALAALAGPRAKEEYVLLKQEVEVRQYLALAFRGRLATLAADAVETIDRHLLLWGVRLARPLSPMSSGNMQILRVGEEEIDPDELARFTQASVSPALRRWLELEVAVAAALKEAQDSAALLLLGPRELTPDAAGDFAKLCVAAKK